MAVEFEVRMQTGPRGEAKREIREFKGLSYSICVQLVHRIIAAPCLLQEKQTKDPALTILVTSYCTYAYRLGRFWALTGEAELCPPEE